MCGIVGYIGSKPALPILLEGLKRLEYRGYDSAGVVLVENDRLHGKKTKGRIQDLEERLGGAWPSALGIAHTRWATHGAPSGTNAHPHYDCRARIAVVHNGIIENYQPLKQMLIGEGHRFSSETDTEVLAHLIEKFYTQNLGEATRQALRHVRGAYGIAVVAADQPNVIIAARLGSPLVVGIGEQEEEYYVASDVTALIPFTKKVVYPNDGELVRLSRQGFQTITLKNEWVHHGVTEISLEAEKYEKGAYPHFMLKEIMEEPEVVRKASAGRLQLAEGTARLAGLNLTDAELRAAQRLLIIGCGSAFYAGFAGQRIIETVAGIPVQVEPASEFRYGRMLIPPNTLIFVISQSGETADTIAALREAKRQGHRVYGISNVVGSTIARETDGGMFIYAGPEIGVATTKAFLGQLTTLTLLALMLGRLRGLQSVEGQRIAAALAALPAQIEETLRRRPAIRAVAEKYRDARSTLVIGRGRSFPIALEGALKLKEVAYVHAEAYPAGEMKHGPIALVEPGFPTFVIAPKDSVYEKTCSNLEEIRARDGEIIAIATDGDQNMRARATDVLSVPATHEALTPFLTVIPFQLLAYELGVIKHLDVDKPRNLAKSVTVE